ncbi:hypothetical protein ACLOJK_018072 [Asimina triloba]
MIRWWFGALALLELFVSTALHILCGLYILSTAVALDVSQALTIFFRAKPKTAVDEELEFQELSSYGLLPIVLVHGIFGFGKGVVSQALHVSRLGGLSYFAGAEKKTERVLVPDLGSLTSIHDRARELFYYLKGGRVDYGEEHSRIYGHSRFGRMYEKGHYPEWDGHHPIHFVAHSAGAQVVRLLQQMLADKSFEGHHDTNDNWVLSITSLSGALNGTTRTYLDGMLVEDGRSMQSICLLQVLRIGVTFYHWFNFAWLKNYYSFGFEHFNFTWQKTGIMGLVDCLSCNAGPFASGDWVLPDLTIQGSMKLNSKIKTFPHTFYFSYASKRTRKIMGITFPSSVFGIHPLLLVRAMQMSQWRHPQDILLPFKGYR